jgi:tRNA(adenine34) deaminase
VGIESHLESIQDDIKWMKLALEEAQKAGAVGEVPVGAIIVNAQNELVARGYNQPISACDPTAHAEIYAIREAANLSDNYRIPGHTLYVTIEPCTMCVGALVHARLGRLVYGASEPKMGAIESAFKLLEAGCYNHVPDVTGGILAEDCARLMSGFFARRRKEKVAERTNRKQSI